MSRRGYPTPTRSRRTAPGRRSGDTRGISEQSEAQFQAAVIEAAKLHGWRCYHTHDSRRSQAGFPDLVLGRPSRLLFIELKTNAGRLRPEQREWLEMLRACGMVAEVWRPGDWPRIERMLRTGEPAATAL